MKTLNSATQQADRKAPDQSRGVTAEQGIFLGRQPILDRDGAVVAYELLFRSGTHNGASGMPDARKATAMVIQRALVEMDIESVLGACLGYINFDEQMLMSDLVECLPRDRVVIEVLESVTITEAIAVRVRTLRALGFRIALDDYTGTETARESLLPDVDVIKVDLAALGGENLEVLAARLRRYGKMLLAEKVETREMAQRCRDCGFELFQGYFFARPAIIQGRRASPDEQAVFRLIGLIASDADNSAIAAVLRETPQLSINLMRIVNSAAVGARQRLTTMNQALAMIGRRDLNRWLQILLFSTAGDGRKGFPNALASMAATRGMMLETCARSLRGRAPDFADRAFMTGMFSLAGALLGGTAEEILGPLPIADDVKRAILEREGELGRLLDLVEVYENGAAQALSAKLAVLPELDERRVNANYTAALAWADSLGAEGNN